MTDYDLMAEALDGARRVYARPEARLIGVWYGGFTGCIFDMETWEKLDSNILTDAEWADEIVAGNVESSLESAVDAYAYLHR